MLRYVSMKFSGSYLVLDETSRGARYFCDTRTNSENIYSSGIGVPVGVAGSLHFAFAFPSITDEIDVENSKNK